jgi:peptidoglycan/LPS O-acetylase OafA/YrhL
MPPFTAAETRTSSPPARATFSGHIVELDGLRGIAILLVCAFHFSFVMVTCPLPAAQSLQKVLWIGWCGVDLFFALSGFLITGILLDSAGSKHYFRTFYIRRALRIFPLYFAFLAIMLGLLHHVLWRHKYPGITTWWYLVYLQNWKPNHTAGDLHVDHLWSLAIEEQFYMVWPLIVWLFPRRWIAPLTLAIAAVAVFLRCAVMPRFGYDFMYRGTLTRMDGLALGAFIAVAVRTPGIAGLLRRLLPFGILVSAAVLASAFVVQGNFQWDRPMQVYGTSAMAVLFALLVFWCVDLRPRLMRSRLLQSFARYAYAIYVFHSPLNQIVSPQLERLWQIPAPAFGFVLRCFYIVAMTGLSWSLAWLSWRYFEGPINRLKRYIPYG